MKAKIICFLVMTLLISSAITSVGIQNKKKNNITNNQNLYMPSWSTTEVISTESDDYSSNPHIEYDDGLIHVVWDDTTFGYTDPNGYTSDVGNDIFYKNKNYQGYWYSSNPMYLVSWNCYYPYFSEKPTLDVDQDGKIYVFWEDNSPLYPEDPTADKNIFRSYNIGGGWFSAMCISADDNDDSENPSCVIDPSGRVHLAWYQSIDPDEVTWRSRNYNTGDWGTIQTISSESYAGDSRHPSIDVDSSGVAYIVWQDETNYFDPNSGYCGVDKDIFYKYCIDANLGIWSNTEVVSTDSYSDSSYPDIAAGNDGKVHVVWHDGSNIHPGDNNFKDIFYKYLDLNTGIWSSVEWVSTEREGTCGYPSIDVDSTGTIHVAWHQRNLNQKYDVVYKYRNPSTGWSTTEFISTESSEHAKYASLTLDDTGGIHIAWQDSTNYNDPNSGSCGNDEDIFYKSNINLPPNDMEDPPYGPLNGVIEIFYDFSAYTTDPDGDELFYLFDWGDGTQSEWIGPVNSGENVTASHKWTSKGDYNIKVKARDIFGAETNWSPPYSISIPRSKSAHFNLFSGLFSYLTSLYPILKILCQ